MGMEYRCKTCCSPKLWIITCKSFQQLLYTLEHQGIDPFLIHPGEFTQLFWQGKGEQVILGWELLAQLIFNPLPPFMILAMRTTPVAA